MNLAIYNSEMGLTIQTKLYKSLDVKEYFSIYKQWLKFP